jgi:hypothetical protein
MRTIVIYASALAVALGAAARSAAEHGSAHDMRWEERAGESLALRDGHGVVWQFNYGPERTMPCFHPVALPGGKSLTVDGPADHPWHHALWFSWVRINGVNYWEHDPQTQRPLGVTQWTDVVAERRPDFGAEIALELAYRTGDQQPALREMRRIVLSPPDADGSYALDWRLEFVAGDDDVELACTPIPPQPGGVAWGGYAGLSVRFAAELADRQVITPEGVAQFDASGIFRTRERAADYSGALDQRMVGLALLDHPQNERAPTDWYAIASDMSYLNPAWLARGPFVLPAGERLTLRYRVVIHPGRWNAEQLTTAWQAYATTEAAD